MSVAPDWCHAYLGLPYRDRGRDRAGLDCYGLVMLVNREQFGRIVPDYVYRSATDGDAVAATVAANLECDWAPTHHPAAGDLVMLRIAGRPWHCGVVAAPGLMLHVIDHSRSGIERLNGLRWSRRIIGYYRPRVIEPMKAAA